MLRSVVKSVVVAMLLGWAGLATAQVFPDEEPLTLEAIEARHAQPLSRDEVLKMVTGTSVEWLRADNSGRRWTNDPGGQLWSSRFSAGAGSFNPHYRQGKGEWTVRDDASFCVHIDYRIMQIEDFCWRFYSVDGHVLMDVTPPSPGARIRFYR